MSTGAKTFMEWAQEVEDFTKIKCRGYEDISKLIQAAAEFGQFEAVEILSTWQKSFARRKKEEFTEVKDGPTSSEIKEGT